MATQPTPMRMNVEDYFVLDSNSSESRYEFIDGYVYMLAGGTADHAIISANVIRALGNMLSNGTCNVYTSDMKVRISEKRYVYPDISVSCDSRDRGKIDTLHHPHLVIEILSPSTEAYDRGMKSSYYRACTSIQEYVLIDTQRQAVEVYRRNQAPFWQFSAFEGGDQVKLTSLDISIPISAIYKNIELPEDNES